MKWKREHPWPESWAEASDLQSRLAGEIGPAPLPRLPRTVAGTDISFSRGSSLLFAAVVVLELPRLETIEIQSCRAEARFPYRPGFLSFRELPPLLECIERLEHRPGLFFCDGQGLAHPRRFGLACHLGWWLDMPVVGCAKSRLVGVHREPGQGRGCRTSLNDPRTGELLGAVLRTRSSTRPIYVSTGHRILLDDAVRVTLTCSPRYRVPEPIRAAHRTVNELRKGENGLD